MKTYYTIGYISTLGANGTPSNPQVANPNTPANSVTGLPNSKLQEAIDKLFLSMTESNIPSVRLSYLRVVEKLFLFIRSKANSLRASFDKQSTASPDDTKANGLILLLNDLLGRLVKVNETNAYNLLYMFDIIFQFISVQVHAGYPFPMKTTGLFIPFFFIPLIL
jgi:hypothetical protein